MAAAKTNKTSKTAKAPAKANKGTATKKAAKAAPAKKVAFGPLSTVKGKFGDKAKLVAAVTEFMNDGNLWLSNAGRGDGLAHVPNAKLLKLHATFTEVKSKFGTRSKLIDAVCELEKRTKDEGYKTRLGGYPVPRLFDMYQSASKRVARAQALASKAPTKKAPAPAKPKAKTK
jgi:hypothetical protein